MHTTDRTYGTVLRNVPAVEAQYTKTIAQGGLIRHAENWQPPIDLPAEFNGRVRWRNYLAPIRTQGRCGDCFSVATVTAFGDRFALYTLNQVKSEMSPCSLTICDYSDIDDLETYQAAFRDLQAAAKHKQTALANVACFGNTLINAARFLFFQGVPSLKCCGEGSEHLRSTVENFRDVAGLPLCEKLQGLQHTHCSDSRQAMRVFRARTYGVVQGSEEYLKFSIYKFGPFVAGFDVYPDFLDEYTGHGIYIPKPHQATVGGHAVRVVGYGGGPGTSEPIPYWIIANSWGTDWGDQGYFKMQRGTCSLEDNVVITIPALNNYMQEPAAIAEIKLTPEEQKIRDSYPLDAVTKYPVAALRLMRSGQLTGDLHPIINYAYTLPALGTFYCGRDVPEVPPVNIPRLPEVPLRVLLRNNGIAAITHWQFISLVTFFVIMIILVIYWRQRK